MVGKYAVKHFQCLVAASAFWGFQISLVKILRNILTSIDGFLNVVCRHSSVVFNKWFWLLRKVNLFVYTSIGKYLLCNVQCVGEIKVEFRAIIIQTTYCKHHSWKVFPMKSLGQHVCSRCPVAQASRPYSTSWGALHNTCSLGQSMVRWSVWDWGQAFFAEHVKSSFFPDSEWDIMDLLLGSHKARTYPVEFFLKESGENTDLSKQIQNLVHF